MKTYSSLAELLSCAPLPGLVRPPHQLPESVEGLASVAVVSASDELPVVEFCERHGWEIVGVHGSGLRRSYLLQPGAWGGAEA